MCYRVLKGLLLFSFIFNTSAIGIDGKLDFGNSHSSPSFRSENTEHNNVAVPVKYTKIIKTVESSDDFDNIGVVCVSGGCNTTKTTTNLEDTLQTDVIVHVKTKVNLSHNKTKPVDDTSDIPVIIGFGGSKLDSTVDEDSSRSLSPQSIFVTEAKSTPKIPSYNMYPTSSAYNPPVSTYYSPSISSRTSSVNTGINSDFNSFNPHIDTSKFYVPESLTQTEPKVNINIETLPPVAVSVSESGKPRITDTKYEKSAIKLTVPYFEPSYHNHYYGENPPPQYIWYPKKSNAVNPVEFKTVKSAWTPSMWHRKIWPHGHSSGTVNTGVECTCKNGQTTPGLLWYPNSSRRVSNGALRMRIDDKLAPLN